MTKKLISCILVVCMLLSMLPTMAWAEPVATGSDLDEPVASGTDLPTGTLDISKGSIIITDTGYTQGTHKFTDRAGYSIVDDEGNPVTETAYTGEITIIGENVATSEASRYVIMVEGAGQTITLNNVTSKNNDADSGSKVPAFVLMSGTATLKLEGTNVLVGTPQSPAVQINKDATLTITATGTGSLDASTSNNTAAIGAPRGGNAYNEFSINSAGRRDNTYSHGGNLIIESGIINAFGNSTGAGIGASHSSQFGNITINGGSVTVNSLDKPSPAGINTSTNSSGGGDITINGGKVSVTINGNNYAAIGGGNSDSNVCSGDVTITGGEISVDVTKHRGAYAIRTGGNFKMTGGTLVKLLKFANSTNPYITANTVSITGGNINNGYTDEITGRKLTKLVFTEEYAGKEVLVSETNDFTTPEKYWSALVSDDGTITTYLDAEAEKVYFKLNGDTTASEATISYGVANMGTQCTCSAAGTIEWVGKLEEELTLYKEMVSSKDRSISASYKKVETCAAIVHPGYDDVKVTMTVKDADGNPVADAADYATYKNGKLTMKKPAGVEKYTVTLTAANTAGTPVTKSVTVTIKDTHAGEFQWTNQLGDVTMFDGVDEIVIPISAKYAVAETVAEGYKTVKYSVTVKDKDGTVLNGGVDSYATYADGTLTLKRQNEVYSVELKAETENGEVSETQIAKVISSEEQGLDVVNGPITVEAASEAGKVTYKQGDNEFTVGKDVPVTITGTYEGSYANDESPNLIRVTDCSPTIVLKNLSITVIGRYLGESFVIDGTRNAAGEIVHKVTLLIEGENTIIRNINGNDQNPGIDIRDAEVTIDCVTHKNTNCDEATCADKLTVAMTGSGNNTAAIGSRYVPATAKDEHNQTVDNWDRDGDGVNENEPEGFTLNINGGCIEAISNGFGAAIGTCRVSAGTLTNKVAINISDGYVKAIANDDGVAIGAGRSDNPPNEGIVSVNISGGIVEAISKSLGNVTNATSDAILASEVTVSGGAEVTVSGNLKAKKSVEVKGTGTTLELKEKEGWDESYGNNPGGNICNGAEWKDSTTGETVVRPGNVQVKVSDGAALTTEGGINGSLTTSGNATANINGVAPQSGKAGTDKSVGGVSGTVTVGAGSKVTVTEEIKKEVTVEGGATINGTEMPEDVAIPAGKLGEVKKDAETGAVSLPAGSTVAKEDGSKVTLTEGGTVAADGAITAEGAATITKADGSSVELSEGGTMAADGAITAGGTVTTKDKDGNVVSTVVVPEGKDATVSADGKVTAPAGTVVTDKDGKENTLTNGGTVDKDGVVTETKPPYSGGYYPSYTPSETPATPSVDSSSLNNAALAVGSAIKDGSAEFTPVNGYTKDEIVKLQKESKLEMSIEKKTEYSAADKKLIDNAITKAGGAVSDSVMYFDITVVLKHTDTGAKVAEVRDTEKAISITVDLNDALQKAAKDGKFLYAVRCHEGVTTFLETKLNAAKTAITFESSEFSTYAVVAMDKAVALSTTPADDVVTPEPGKPADKPAVDEPIVDEPVVDEPVVDEAPADDAESSGGNVGLWIGIGIVALAAIVVALAVMAARKKRRAE